MEKDKSCDGCKFNTDKWHCNNTDGLQCIYKIKTETLDPMFNFIGEDLFNE